MASNGSHHKTTRPLRPTGLLEPFTGRMFSADDVARPKPAPDLHLHAAARMGVGPRHRVVIEDSPFVLDAARTAGMRTLGFAGGVNSAERLAGPGTILFHHMSELPDLLGDVVLPTIAQR